jgi:hypothetical protein
VPSFRRWRFEMKLSPFLRLTGGTISNGLNVTNADGSTTHLPFGNGQIILEVD